MAGCRGRLSELASPNMSTTVDQPVPKDLRVQMLRRLESMPDEDVTELYELILLQEKPRLRREISAEAER